MELLTCSDKKHVLEGDSMQPMPVEVHVAWSLTVAAGARM
jgi:hypothetical protein